MQLNRITNVDAAKWHGSVNKEMTLEAGEFIRRYALHILPKGLVRIRHYGILSSTSKQKAAICIKAQLPPAAPLVIIRRILSQDTYAKLLPNPIQLF